MTDNIKAVTFDEENHKYFYSGKELHGITGAIGKLMGKNFPDTDTVKLATVYGTDVHKEAELYVKEGKIPSTEAGKWLTDKMKELEAELQGDLWEAEVMVSDFEGTASKVDLVLHDTKTGEVYLFDIKTTSHFDREYCSLQLSVYKKLYEQCYGAHVKGMFVLGTKARRVFRIFLKSELMINKILNMNKGV